MFMSGLQGNKSYRFFFWGKISKPVQGVLFAPLWGDKTVFIEKNSGQHTMNNNVVVHFLQPLFVFIINLYCFLLKQLQLLNTRFLLDMNTAEENEKWKREGKQTSEGRRGWVCSNRFTFFFVSLLIFWRYSCNWLNQIEGFIVLTKNMLLIVWF